MLTKSEYDILMDIMELPNHGFPENECPSYIEWSKVSQAITLGYMEKAALSTPGDDPNYPEGRSWYKISDQGYHLIEEYQEYLAKSKLDALSTVVGHVISSVTKG